MNATEHNGVNNRYRVADATTLCGRELSLLVELRVWNSQPTEAKFGEGDGGDKTCTHTMHKEQVYDFRFLWIICVYD